jgi:peptide/nickel transport system permease protein
MCSAIQRDLNLLLGILFFSSLLVMAANIVTDLLYARLDPRVSLR